jgi:hypothetical protein
LRAAHFPPSRRCPAPRSRTAKPPPKLSRISTTMLATLPG